MRWSWLEFCDTSKLLANFRGKEVVRPRCSNTDNLFTVLNVPLWTDKCDSMQLPCRFVSVENNVIWPLLTVKLTNAISVLVRNVFLLRWWNCNMYIILHLAVTRLLKVMSVQTSHWSPHIFHRVRLRLRSLIRSQSPRAVVTVPQCRRSVYPSIVKNENWVVYASATMKFHNKVMIYIFVDVGVFLPHILQFRFSGFVRLLICKFCVFSGKRVQCACGLIQVWSIFRSVCL